MVPIFAWLVAIPVLGFLTGSRTMTPIAVLCLFAWRGHMDLYDSWAVWATHGISALIFGVLAVGELIGDKLPQTPNRTSPFALIARICFGGLVGALAATALRGSAIEGGFLGAAAAGVGTFIGFHVRKHLVEKNGWKDLYVALAEDAIVIGGSVLMMGIVTG